MKEHRDACEKGMLEKSAVAEHAWEKLTPSNGKRDVSSQPSQKTQVTVAEGGPPHLEGHCCIAF